MSDDLADELVKVRVRLMDTLDALRRGDLTPTEANKLTKLAKEWRRDLEARIKLAKRL
jgi:hypothetical protein